MRRKVAFVVAAVALALAAPLAATAHPLGNFTINRYSRIDVSGKRVFVLYVLDMAEIPTFQAGRIDARAYARRIAGGVRLLVDGKPAPLVPLREALAHPPGAGGLRTTRLEVVLAGPVLQGRASVVYHDDNYSGRIGWREIVVRGDAGASVLRSSAPAHSSSDELRAYPKDLLRSPLAVTSARATVVPGNGPATPPALTAGRALEAPDRVADSGFARLVGRGHLSLLVVLASLGAALFWGAAHALSPGHGKTIVTAYLVGQRGRPRHAALLGLTVTVTHTIGVFALGLVTLALSQFVVPETLYPWLNLASGLLVVTIGASVLRSRLRRRARANEHDHAHGHDHGHGKHRHDGSGGHGGHGGHGGESLSLRSLVAVGVSGGLLPCPSALVVLLAAISLHRLAFGLVLIVAFSIGLAAAVTGVGLLAILAKRLFARTSLDGRLARALPALSALVILGAGAMMTARALPKLT